ncbi:non-specific lipid transfer protein GPI-anchored 7 [Lactuca sativa]|uniref:non-specific lipid transfer protein GPI-anchored 7 n=1 Tax=Lactuca sativa TaxID=4236 RepID=UPI000CBCEFDC|nr:non-specific lipid transfer protein GPI-anchored 7 [Lactuca sativa]
MASSFLLTVVVALMVMSVSVSTAQAQAECASKLVPCAQYLNATTKPPNTCCDPIKEAVATDLQCLCNLYENPAFLSGIGINIDQALRLPQLCGIPSDTSACNTTAQSPAGSTTQTPPGRTPGAGGGNGVGKIASSGVIGLLLISACMMLF